MGRLMIPIVVLMPTGRCNSRCVMCDYWRSTDGAQLGLDDVVRLVGEMPSLGVRHVAFSGGEPLLHEDLPGMFAVARATGMQTTLMSNGMLLARDALALAPSCDDYVLSLDGPAEIHDRIRGVSGAFRLLGEGISAVRSANPSAGIAARCTVQAANWRHLRRTVTAARELGFDALSFVAVDPRPGMFGRSGDAAGLGVGAGEIDGLRREVHALIREHADDLARGFIAESPEKLRRTIVQRLAARRGVGDPPTPRCNAPWVSVVIEPDGAARPCFSRPALGCVSEGSLAEVVSSEPFRRLRADLNVESDDICRDCTCTLSLKV